MIVPLARKRGAVCGTPRRANQQVLSSSIGLPCGPVGRDVDEARCVPQLGQDLSRPRSTACREQLLLERDQVPHGKIR